MLTGAVISGQLQLSAGVAPEDGIPFSVTLRNSVSSTDSALQQVVMEEGQNSTPYQFTVDSDATKVWLLGYECSDFASTICADIDDEGYFDAASGNTVSSPENATRLVGGVDHTNLRLTVEGDVLAPGICLLIRASNGNIAVICL